MKPIIFLGGTVGSSNWRGPFTEELIKEGIPPKKIFNPAVADWTPACQVVEDKAKAKAMFNLFYICSPTKEGTTISTYSIVEAIMGLYDDPKRTVVVFENSDYTGHSLKAIIKIEKDLRKRFPKGSIFSSSKEAANALSWGYWWGLEVRPRRYKNSYHR